MGSGPVKTLGKQFQRRLGVGGQFWTCLGLTHPSFTSASWSKTRTITSSGTNSYRLLVNARTSNPSSRSVGRRPGLGT